MQRLKSALFVLETLVSVLLLVWVAKQVWIWWRKAK
jgi:hypothetical protein